MPAGAEDREPDGGALALALESAQRVLARHAGETAWLQLFMRVAYAFEEMSREASAGASRAFFAQSNPEVLVRLLAAWLARPEVAAAARGPGMQEALDDLRAALASSATAPAPVAAPAPVVAPAASQAAVDAGPAAREDRVSRSALLSSSLGTVEVAERLGLTRQAVNQRRAKGRLLGLQRGREFAYPAWQFDPETGEVPAALEQALALLGGASDEAKVRFFVEPAPELDGARPLEVLQQGRGDDVVVAAAKAIARLSG